jgi:hypothetical protein
LQFRGLVVVTRGEGLVATCQVAALADHRVQVGLGRNGQGSRLGAGNGSRLDGKNLRDRGQARLVFRG